MKYSLNGKILNSFLSKAKEIRQEKEKYFPRKLQLIWKDMHGLRFCISAENWLKILLQICGTKMWVPPCYQTILTPLLNIINFLMKQLKIVRNIFRVRNSKRNVICILDYRNKCRFLQWYCDILQVFFRPFWSAVYW